jgi:hypothetical protein
MVMTEEEMHLPFYLVVRPGVGDEARMVPDSPQGPQLVMDVSGAQFAVQVDRDDPGGAELAAMFARHVAAAAIRFAKCCDDMAGRTVAGAGEIQFER